MAYVLKNAQNKIIAISDTEKFGENWIQMDDTAKEYIAYLDAQLTKSNPFRESDINLARVLEDLIDLLIDRDIIHFSDFPQAAQKRLLDRQTMRKQTQLSNLLDDSNGIL